MEHSPTYTRPWISHLGLVSLVCPSSPVCDSNNNSLQSKPFASTSLRHPRLVLFSNLALTRGSIFDPSCQAGDRHLNARFKKKPRVTEVLFSAYHQCFFVPNTSLTHNGTARKYFKRYVDHDTFTCSVWYNLFSIQQRYKSCVEQTTPAS